MLKKREFVSLFSGAMGLDIGLEQAGFDVACCVENDNDAVSTIRTNRPSLKVIAKSIVDVKGSDILETMGWRKNTPLPLLVGGPPCQAFSVFGNRLGIQDARGTLVFEFVRLVDELKPTVFLMENVRGIMSISLLPRSNSPEIAKLKDDYYSQGSLFRKVISELNSIGYRVDCFVVNAVNYGAPQIRERVFLIGHKGELTPSFPSPTHSNRIKDRLLPFTTLGEIIDPALGFVDPYPEVLDFSPRKLKFLAMVPPGGNWRSLPVDVQKESMGKSWYLKGGRSAYWRKLSFAFPSPTVVTMPNHAGTSMCHPEHLRAISVGEAAAIQEFPRDWIFSGNTASKFRQIGNAVPIRLARMAGRAVAELLDNLGSGASVNAPRTRHTVTHLRPHVRTRTFYRDGEVYSGDVDYYRSGEKDNKKEQITMALE